MTSISVQQNAHGSYTIFPAGKTAHSATGFIIRNQRGGGYTLEMNDGRTTSFRHMPVAETWAEFEGKIAEITEGC